MPHIDLEVAHDPLNQAGPEAVVSGEDIALGGGEFAPGDALRVAPKHHLVLGVALREPPNAEAPKPISTSLGSVV